jgi:hypothetical protein
MISRDRCGSFAQGAREGAPQARQIADRFHILQNLREAIQAQLSRAAGSSVRALLPASNGDDEREDVISWSPRNMAAPSIAASREWRRWAEGCVRSRRLFQEIKARGYTGSFSNLERLLAKWRCGALCQAARSADKRSGGES